MPEKLDTQTLTTTMLGIVEKTLSTMGVAPSSPTESKEVDIEEYDGRMRVLSMHDFESSIYIGIINFYLTQEDMERHKATKGALVLYVDTEYASKLYKALNFPFPDDEDDASMLNGCGEFCKALSNALKDELSGMGYAALISSAPSHYKNSVLDGVEYPQDQHSKCRLSFFYWKRKVVVVELTLSNIPSKR